jgi:hypothetical protein
VKDAFRKTVLGRCHYPRDVPDWCATHPSMKENNSLNKASSRMGFQRTSVSFSSQFFWLLYGTSWY